MKIDYANRLWYPQEFVVCMAMDAFRIAFGMKGKNFTDNEVLAWLAAQISVRT